MFEVLRERMQEHAHRIAIVSDGQEYSYSALADAVAVKERAYRKANIGSGDIVVLVGEFSFESLACMLALFFCKATIVPLTVEAHAKLGKHVVALQPNYLIDTYHGSAVQPCAHATYGAEWRAFWNSSL